MYLKFLQKIKSYLLLILLLWNVIILVPLNAYADNSTNNKLSSKTIEKLAANYSKKFCNGLAFGLSKESALEFTVNENKQLLNKKYKGSKLSDELLSYEISSKIVNDCGYPIGLSGEQGVLEFQKLLKKQLKA